MCTALPRSRARDWLCKIRSSKLEFRKIAKFRVLRRLFRFKFLRKRAFKLFENTATRHTGGTPLCTALPRSRARVCLCKIRSSKLEFRKSQNFAFCDIFFASKSFATTRSNFLKTLQPDRPGAPLCAPRSPGLGRAIGFAKFAPRNLNFEKSQNYAFSDVFFASKSFATARSNFFLTLQHD